MALLRRAWFQIHWFIGITAGSVLVLIGLTGATLSFRAEIIDAINPELRHAPNPGGATALLPAALAQQLQAAHPKRRIVTLTVFAEPGRPARVNFAPPEGQRQGEVRLVDPWTAELLPEPKGDAFFEFVESLHRWLLLPRDTGKPVTGTLATGLLILALSGLYLRWPRRPLAWRAWLKLDFALTGRAFLWNLHAVVGTIALLAYLASSLTGLYWGFDGVRTLVDNAAGEGRMVRTQRMQAGGAAAQATAAPKPDLQRVWQSFLQETNGDWSLVTLRMPTRNATQIEATYLRANPEHERARNRLYLDAVTGEATQHERYADKPLAGRLVNSIYPLHMGTYWGLPGRIVMTLSSLGLSLFAITGWMLYLGRRRTKRAVRDERARLSPALPLDSHGAEPVLLTFATQTGHAERIALQTAAVLQSAGVAVVLQPLVRLSVDALQRYRKVLLVASTFGDGDPPDSLRAFARQFARQTGSGLQNVHYGLLALGDRHYANFCGFGRALDHDLRGHGAQALFPMIEVSNGDAGALARWQQSLADTFAVQVDTWQTHQPKVAPFEPWRLVRRTLLNAGSQGAPLFEIELARPDSAAWKPGALVELLPRQAGPAVEQFLRSAGLDGRTLVRFDGHERTLEDALSRSTLMTATSAATAQALADTLVPLAPRSYSVASIATDGCVQLLVRQVRHDDGLGIASGWLTASAPADATIELRLLPNPGFALVDDEVPCIFIGNGSGFAGLRAHLRERARRGHGRNWLVYGERNAAHDSFCATDIAQWQAAGALERVDLVFSRDQAQRRYVQDRLRETADALRQWVAERAVIYVCGSLEGMAPGVDSALREALGEQVFDDLVAQGRYRRDVY
ncbi:sulfite reductase (NADPH) flavoprotein alpha-component [Variovorax boronicumulans]|uniref:sulfite reductase flavoprotein subunit alpha n=1 Tax=Variovorax boronicumulans TaxID=436515 RepID=UPI0027864C60|nr:sulfite reductase flavoprotein subunit alpha [Variovorax boronicumulans]MDQ0084641.1 sulfite reductase (NADPH) flavoprotein alpha-component [Variovorax boronicumulans]